MDIRGIENLEKTMIKEIDDRFDDWNAKKKSIARKVPVNKTEMHQVRFDIKSWTLW